MHKVQARGILSPSNGMNIYRGCTHGCIYCDSRSECYGFTHDFEDIEVKENAPFLLEKALRAKRRRCMIGTGAMCDPYLHAEKELMLTRRCLEVIDKYEFGVAIQTKSDLILRDIDLIESINRKAKAVVQMTLTTADEQLCKIIEPAVCTTAARFEVLMECRRRNIPTVMWMCPILPFINDTEENLLSLLDYAKRAKVYGILTFGIGMTLRNGDREYYYAALDRNFPGLKQRYISRYGDSYNLPSPNGERLWKIFVDECTHARIEWRTDAIFDYLHRFEEPEQLTLF